MPQKPLTIGSVVLGKIPRVIGVVDTFLDMRRIAAIKKTGVDILEIRVDLLGADIPGLCVFIDKIKKTSGSPCIATVRETDENRDRRIDIFKAILPFVDAIDIEIDASISRQVISHAKGKTVIVSEHDFKKTPDIPHLERIVKKAESLGAHIVKIAAMAKNRRDVARLMTFSSLGKKNLVAISMGDYGAISRVLAPVFGSLFTYGFTAKSVAPGQMSVEQLIEEMKRYYPDYSGFQKE
jgi:3-dehydroquinate dehydratase-1